MRPSTKDVKSMASLINIMNGDKSKNVKNNNNVINGPSSFDRQKDMKLILERLNAVSSKVVKEIIVESKNDNNINESLIIEKKSKGIKIGDYLINQKLNESNIGPKIVYDLSETNSNSLLLENLYLRSAAMAIGKLLNHQKDINHPKIQEILELENKFASRRNEASIFVDSIKRHKKNKVINENIIDIYEARFIKAKDLATLMATKIKKINNSII